MSAHKAAPDFAAARSWPGKRSHLLNRFAFGRLFCFACARWVKQQTVDELRVNAFSSLVHHHHHHEDDEKEEEAQREQKVGNLIQFELWAERATHKVGGANKRRLFVRLLPSGSKKPLAEWMIADLSASQQLPAQWAAHSVCVCVLLSASL